VEVGAVAGPTKVDQVEQVVAETAAEMLPAVTAWMARLTQEVVPAAILISTVAQQVATAEAA